MTRPNDMFESEPSSRIRFSINTEAFHTYSDTMFKALHITGFDVIDPSLTDLIDVTSTNEIDIKTKFGFVRAKFYDFSDKATGIPLAYIKNHLPEDTFSISYIKKPDHIVMYFNMVTHMFTTTLYLACTIFPDGKLSKAWAYVEREYMNAQYLTQMDIAIRAHSINVAPDDIVELVIEDTIWEMNERRDEWINDPDMTAEAMALPVDGFVISMEEYMEAFDEIE